MSKRRHAIDHPSWARHEAIQAAVEELLSRYPIGYGTKHERISYYRTEIRRMIGTGQYNISESHCTEAHLPYGELISIIALVT